MKSKHSTAKSRSHQNDSLAVLCVHASRNLPDSLEERKAVLGALARVLRSAHPVHAVVRAQLAGLAAVEKMAAQLRERL